jgi:hypothetical protein
MSTIHKDIQTQPDDHQSIAIETWLRAVESAWSGTPTRSSLKQYGSEEVILCSFGTIKIQLPVHNKNHGYCKHKIKL